MPLITMKVFAEEKKTGTIELITTCPVKDIDIVIGKFLSCALIFLFMILVTFIDVLILGIVWNFKEIMPIMTGYFGLFLFGCSLISLGIFISSLTDNQVIAAGVTMGIIVLFWFLNWNEMIAGEKTLNVLRCFSFYDRVFKFFHGVINTKDIVFFVLFVCFFLFLTLLSIGSRAWRGLE